jgi:hypothetical protein
MSESEIDVLDILHEMLETDRAFYGTLRFMDGGSRSHLMASHMRNHNQLLAIIRAYMLTPSTTNMVLNIPIGTIDPSGNFFDPVPIVPTSQQILNATETNITVAGETCTICQDTITNGATRIRHCGHVFHGNCISQWFSMNARCPVCRHDIRSLRVTSQQNNNESSSLHSDSE